MNVTVQRKPQFQVAGIKLENIESSSCPGLWKELLSKYSHEELSSLGNGQSYGMCFYVGNEDKINYMACYDVVDVLKAREMGLYIVIIKEAEYAILTLKGAIPNCIHKGWEYAMKVFLPEQGYMHAGTPDFEVYGEGDMSSSDYEMELWIPVVKSK